MEKISLSEFLKLEKQDLKGRIFCFPTDTVYGLACLYADEEAIKRIYELKNRTYDKPLAHLCSNINQIATLGVEITGLAEELMKKYWPGPLSLILNSPEGKISFRMPDSKIALKIIDRFSVLPTTSVNESNKPELNSLAEIEAAYGNEIDYLIIDPATFSKLPSTVADISGGSIKILRQGAIYLE